MLDSNTWNYLSVNIWELTRLKIVIYKLFAYNRP